MCAPDSSSVILSLSSKFSKAVLRERKRSTGAFETPPGLLLNRNRKGFNNLTPGIAAPTVFGNFNKSKELPMNRLASLVFGAGAILCAVATQAQAQENTAPPPAASSSYSSGGGSHGKFGVGGIAYMGGTTGLSFVYDPGVWHIDTLIGYSGVGDTDTFNIGGRFWYHLKSSTNADLSIGAGGSLQHVSPPGMGGSRDEVFIEAGALIRVFLAPAVGLGVGSGLVVGAADADGLYIGNGGNTVGLVVSASLHYFF
jgi:hypothetical protein